MKKRRVLVIDDERAIRQTLAQVLTDEGYDVETAADGVDGLDRLARAFRRRFSRRVVEGQGWPRDPR